MSDIQEDIFAPLYEESWEYLYRTHPELEIMVRKLLGKGKTPEDIEREVIKRIGVHREPLAKRCHLAAIHLERIK